MIEKEQQQNIPNIPIENQQNKNITSNKKKKIILILGGLFLLVFITLVGIYFIKKTNIQKNNAEEKLSVVKPLPSVQNTVIVTRNSNDESILFSAINLTNGKETNLFEIKTPKTKEHQQFVNDIKVANTGFIAYKLETIDNRNTDKSLYSYSLYFYDGNQIEKKYVSENDFNFTFSPNNDFIVLLTKSRKENEEEIKRQYDTPEEWIYTKQHIFYTLSLEKGSIPELLLQKDLIDTEYDSSTSFEFVNWNDNNSAKILLQMWSYGQLETTVKDIYELDLSSKSIDKAYSSLTTDFFNNKIFVTADDSSNYIAYKEDEQACCGNLNKTNDKTYVYNLISKTEKTIFDEFERYNNSETSEEQHTTKNISFSPDNKLIAQTIYNIYRSNDGNFNITQNASLLITDIEGNEKMMLDNCAFSSWLDTDKILIAKAENIWKENLNTIETTFDSINVMDINTREIKNVYNGIFDSFKLLSEK